ncbi:MAG: 4Fe-4S dicluster domain-containing protein [Thermoplasmata archaeon]|nr:4Fe-4S dicluster domain-containing protein [Thermoplasmata archaeon]
MPDASAKEAQVRDIARRWLASGEVRYVIGYAAGRGNVARAAFVRRAGDADRLIWNPTCVNNLTLFLREEMLRKLAKGEKPDPRPIGIVVKPCDSKTVVELVKEHIVDPARVRVIGLTCEGVCDPKKLVGTEVGPHAVTADTIADKCTVCRLHNPLMADEVVGDEVPETVEDDYSDVAEIEAMSPEERWAYWERQLSRCVRCYGCREVCPLCYCAECVFDREKPYRWNERTVQLPENLWYHAVRAMHLAGRCIDCGECERVCPMDIPIRKLNRYLEKKAKERYGVEAGRSAEDAPTFGSCDVDDPEEFIW